ncbi:MAG: glycoside hydrolase family 25 protein, partial [Ruminococcus sp.]|nr:glycoside hydrolase family 25 protein [Ruminococcus sp.]
MAKVNCIDLSTFQINVDFNKVKADGVKAVIIRAGYGRETSQKDTEFETHYKNAKAAGLKVGVYWYSYADSVADAEKEAKACLACIKGKSFDMPIYYDLEDSSQTHLGKTTLTAIAKAFCEVIKAAGYKAGVYANLNWFNNYLYYAELKKLYSIWLAQYNATNQLECDIWQNSSTGNISGVSGNVDTNIIFNDDVIGKETTSGTTTTPKTNTNTNTSTKTNNNSNSAK